MKKYIEILTAALLCAGLAACESVKLGDAGLSEAPEASGANVETLFATIQDADKVLASAYYYLPYGLISSFDSKMGTDILEAITDNWISNRHTEGNGPNDLYYTGSLDATNGGGSEAYRFGSEKDYKAIRYGWLFLENADKIKDATPEEIARKKAEAKMCIAIAYSNMFRYLGGVPLVDHAVLASEEMKYPRNTFEETVNFIVNLCNEAAADLPWSVSQVEDGRLTKAAALGLKLRVLCFAASPTFNSDQLWHKDADVYTCYTNYDANRWKAAKAAADEFMTEWSRSGYYAMIQATPDGAGLITPRAYRLAYRKGYYNRGTTETIVSIRKSNSTSYHTMGDYCSKFGCGASLEFANKFGWADGTEFPSDFDWENPSQYPFFSPTGSIPGTETRDPRLYENLCVPGDVWQDGTVGRCYSNHRYFQDNCPGFLMSKYVLQQNSDRVTPQHWCFMRLPEILLNAAEAYNETDGAPSAQAYEWVNSVRARVGLCPLAEGMTKEQFRNALLRERDCEFGFEEFRWFDIVRWGLDEALTTPLHGLRSIGNKDSEATSFTYSVIDAYPTRQWYTKWDRKWFLTPIPQAEINKGYGMTQNPGW